VAVARGRNPLRGSADIALAVGGVIEKHKMRKHFDLTIADASFSFARKANAIAEETATDGIYILRTSLAAEIIDDTDKEAAEAARASAVAKAAPPAAPMPIAS
jgi:hypothetical protein